MNNVLQDESKIFVVDEYESFCLNYDSYMNRLEYQSIKEKFKDIILYKYSNCYQICIHNKNTKQIFVQYMGLTNHEFFDFLVTNEYPNHIVEFVNLQIQSDNYNLNNEIAIVYDIETRAIIRTAFYGNL